MTPQDLDTLALSIAKLIKKALDEKVEPRLKALETRAVKMSGGTLDAITDGLTDAVGPRMKALADRVQALEDRPATLKYCGIWDAADSYDVDEACTYGGGIWVAREATRGEKPGTGLRWQLAVKSARARERR